MTEFENRFSQFTFAPHNFSTPFKRIDTIDIDGIIARRDLETLTSNLDIIINADATSFKETNSWDTFIKLFRLAQFGLEFLLHCKVSLENSLDSTETELEQIKKELRACKYNAKTEVCIPEGKRHVVFRAKIRNPQFKCRLCHKIFINNVYLERHEARRHSTSTKDSYNENKTQHQDLKVAALATDTHNTDEIEGQQKKIEDHLYQNGNTSLETSVIEKPATRLLHLLSNLNYNDFVGEKLQLKNSTPISGSPIKLNYVSNSHLIESKSDEKEGKIKVNRISLLGTEKVDKTQFLEQEVKKGCVKFVEPTKKISNLETAKTERGAKKLPYVEEKVQEIPKPVCRSNNSTSKSVKPQAKEAQTDLSFSSHSFCIHKSNSSLQASNLTAKGERNEIISENCQETLPKDYKRQCIIHEINFVQDAGFFPESHKDDISPVVEEYLEKPRTEGLSSQWSSERRLRFGVEDLDNRMKELGIDPQWKGIPDKVAKKYLATLNLQRRKKSKVYKNYFHIRNTIINQMKKKLKEKMSESSLLSDTLEEDEHI